jgi:hypothetical protein
MTIQTTCRRCGKPIEADRARILAGTWQVCGACRGRRERKPAATVPCEGRGRPLRTGSRTVCARCLGVSLS